MDSYPPVTHFISKHWIWVSNERQSQNLWNRLNACWWELGRIYSLGVRDIMETQIFLVEITLMLLLHTQGFAFKGTFYCCPRVLHQTPLNWLLSKKSCLHPCILYSCKNKSTPGHDSWFCPIRTAVASAWMKRLKKRHVLFLAHKHRCLGPKIALESIVLKMGLSLHRENAKSRVLHPNSTQSLPCLAESTVYVYYGKGTQIWMIAGFKFFAQICDQVFQRSQLSSCIKTTQMH